MVGNLCFYMYAAIFMLSQDRKMNMCKIKSGSSKNVYTLGACKFENTANTSVWLPTFTTAPWSSWPTQWHQPGLATTITWQRWHCVRSSSGPLKARQSLCHFARLEQVPCCTDTRGLSREFRMERTKELETPVGGWANWDTLHNLSQKWMWHQCRQLNCYLVRGAEPQMPG